LSQWSRSLAGGGAKRNHRNYATPRSSPGGAADRSCSTASPGLTENSAPTANPTSSPFSAPGSGAVHPAPLRKRPQDATGLSHCYLHKLCPTKSHRRKPVGFVQARPTIPESHRRKPVGFVQARPTIPESHRRKPVDRSSPTYRTQERFPESHRRKPVDCSGPTFVPSVGAQAGLEQSTGSRRRWDSQSLSLCRYQWRKAVASGCVKAPQCLKP
jgi:hypothetical protein